MRADSQYSEDLAHYTFAVHVSFQSQQTGGEGKKRQNSLSYMFD